MWLNYKILLFQQFVAMVVFYLSSNLSYRHGSHGIYVLSYLHGHLRWYWQIWDRTGKKRDVQIWLVCVRHGKFVISHSYSAWVSVASAPSQSHIITNQVLRIKLLILFTLCFMAHLVKVYRWTVILKSWLIVSLWSVLICFLCHTFCWKQKQMYTSGEGFNSGKKNTQGN